MDATSLSTRTPDERIAIVSAAVALAVVLLAAGLPRVVAQDADSGATSREHAIKAAFVYNFGRYVEWPPEAFPDARSPFVIGVVGPSPVTPNLRRIAGTKKIQDRPIRIRQLSAEEDLGECHILFFPGGVESERRLKIIRRSSRSAILLVGENRDFLAQGGMFDMVLEQNRVRVYIALKATQDKGLIVSSKLLQIAQVVD